MEGNATAVKEQMRGSTRWDFVVAGTIDTKLIGMSFNGTGEYLPAGYSKEVPVDEVRPAALKKNDEHPHARKRTAAKLRVINRYFPHNIYPTPKQKTPRGLFFFGSFLFFHD